MVNHSEEQTRSSSPQVVVSGGKVIFTPSEAQAAGIPWSKEPPQPSSCEFCGAVLHHEGVAMYGTIFLWRAMPRRCTCSQAKERWDKLDAAQTRQAEEAEAAEKSRKKCEQIDRLVIRSGIKRRFLTRNFDTYEITPRNHAAVQTAKDYAENFAQNASDGTGLYFEGTPGTGKTHLAVAIAIKLINDGVPCVCKTSIDMLSDIKRSFDGGELTEWKILSAYKDVDLLVIDDLGKEMCTEWSIAILYDILNGRYEAMRPTIITTNYNDKDLISRLTPRESKSINTEAIMSRLKGCSKVVTMAWEDYRLLGG